MAGIYLHIPYCKQACIYCNFHFSTQVKNKAALVEALLKEIEERKDYLNGEAVETIYFGGGTPSLLSGQEIELLLNKVYATHALSDNIEISLEANPDDLAAPKVKELARAGINRLSIGVQSFLDEDLHFLQRAHNSMQATDSIKAAQDAGINNITIDLIYGIPGQSIEIWLQNLEKVKEVGIAHFSAYSLTVEPKTRLDHLISQKKLNPVDDEQSAGNFITLMNWAEENGYEHYEISNFCRPGSYSRHNSSYWQGKKYCGIGPSAHSYNLDSRQWNIANNELYIKAINSNEPYFEVEKLNTEQKLNEYIMTSLRTKWGFDISKVDKQFIPHLESVLPAHINRGHLIDEGGMIKLSRDGKLLADAIISDLFFV
jgi:oxygen-independent coproporphyrinogen-3 oxidase